MTWGKGYDGTNCHAERRALLCAAHSSKREDNTVPSISAARTRSVRRPKAAQNRRIISLATNAKTGAALSCCSGRLPFWPKRAKAEQDRSLATALHSFRSSTNCSRGLEEEGSTFAAKSVHETSKAKPTDRAKSVICLGENSCHSNRSRRPLGYSSSTKSRSFFILLFSRTVPRAVFSSRSP